MLRDLKYHETQHLYDNVLHGLTNKFT